MKSLGEMLKIVMKIFNLQFNPGIHQPINQLFPRLELVIVKEDFWPRAYLILVNKPVL